MICTCCFLLLLFFHHRVNCVPAECTGLPTSTQIRQRLEVQLQSNSGGDPNAGGGLNALHAFYPACTAQGTSSGTYREYSVVVDYSTGNVANAIILFNLECLQLIAGYPPTWEAAGLSQVDSGFQFMTIEPRSNCSGCSASAGNDFNCEGTKTLNRIYKIASTLCTS